MAFNAKIERKRRKVQSGLSLACLAGWSRSAGLCICTCVILGVLPPPLAAHGDIHSSIAAISRKIAQHPDDASLYFQRAQYYQVDRDFESAKRDYLRAQALRPDLDMTDYGLAALHLDHGFLKEASQYIASFLQRRPEHARGQYLRALIAVAAERPADAMEGIAACLKMLEKPQPEHFLLAAQTALQIDSTDLDGALGWLDRGEDMLGSNIVLAENYIQFAMYYGAHRRALQKVDAVLAYFPRPEKWRFKKGVIYEMMVLPTDALAEYNACLEAISGLPPRHKSTAAVMALQAAALERRDILMAKLPDSP